MELKKVLIASSNPKKAKEIEEFLKPLGIEVVLPPRKLEVEETGTTFLENAYLKAKAYHEEFGLPTLADDSGLIADAIAPYPGIYSARFYSLEVFGREKPTPSEDTANIRKLLRVLKDKENRNARFVACIVLYLGDGKGIFTEGVVKGYITDTPRGDKGFGYDPIFVPEGFNVTFAQMELSQKQKISHRGRALKKLVQLLKTLLG
ncbi:MAG: non-canonical purine NTP pyrophosphatase, RdgB/HAM1 family [Aquificaceae bacterium]|nr:MAG: non-canonical purine NTP pyrophosphatase, RdgB/HAM1 family [Aquificaceae bacterium]